MRKYDDIIVGSGISGLTMALFLALNGRKVMLLEKNPHIGGSIARFYKKGIPFDVGFHFTGGLQEGGILYNTLNLLGILDLIQPIFFPEEKACCFFLGLENRKFELPYGIENIKRRFKGYFPEETAAIDKFFEMAQSVCVRTPSLNLHTLTDTFAPLQLDEDFISLDAVLKGLTSNRMLTALLSANAMCYGVKPREISFANHSRMCYNFYESIASVKGGGNGFIKAFETKFENLEVDIRCGRHIEELTDIKGNKVGSCVLSDGEEVSSDNFIFTIHPHEILKILPKKYFSKAFINRVTSFESSVGFFAVFATLDSQCEVNDLDPAIISLFPHTDVNQLLDPGYDGRPALVLIKSGEQVEGKNREILHVLEVSSPEQVSAWKDSETGRRPQGYQDYKTAKIETIKEHIFKVIPNYRAGFEVVDAGSILTFRDYLNSPDGSAYGIKQKLGQYNLLGRLSLRNLYVAGQSAVLPGIIGAMISSILVGRSIVGKDQYARFLGKAV